MEAHGGNIYEYEKKGKLLDFSSNINPFGVPESFKNNIDKAISNIVKYPDINYRKLRTKLESYTGVQSSFIFPGNGAVDIIYKGIKASGTEKIIIAAPTFAEYRRGAKIAGIEYEEIQLQNLETGTLDVIEALRVLDQEKSKKILFIICNPNNPNGGLTRIDDLEQLAKKLESKGGRLLIDEAFIEFTEGYPYSSFFRKLEKYNNTMVVRAMTKFFGMPGIRFGYGLTYDKNWLQAIESISEPWAVNTFAELAVETVLTDKEYIIKTKDWINVEREFMAKELGNFSGLKVFPTHSDFLLCRIDKKATGLNGDELYEKLLGKKILIRKSTGFTGLGEEYFRLAIKDRKSNMKLIDALLKVLR